jgi:sugar phosphate isomerase/epimerase
MSMAENESAQPAASRPRRPLFLSAVQFDEPLRAGRQSVLDLAPIASRLGLQGVEYRAAHWRDKAGEFPAVAAQLKSLKLRAVYATTTPFFSGEKAEQEQLLQDIEDAKAFGAMIVRIMLGMRPDRGGGASSIRYGARRAVERAGGRRIGLAMENYSRTPGEQAADLAATLEEFDCRFLGTTLDFANYVTTGQDPVAAIRRLARWITFVHLKDARQTPTGWQSTYLGNGRLPLAEILAALTATGTRAPFCFEFPGEGDPEDAIRKSLDFLRQGGV